MRNSLFHKTQDFLTIIRGTWFLQLINLLALVAFLVIAQGEDILLLVAEHVTTECWTQIITLLLGVLFWSISAEYGTRMLIYLTDNSGRSLDPARVDNRKKYQVWVSRMALFFPVVLMICAFIKVYSFNHHQIAVNYGEKAGKVTAGTIIIIISLIAEGALLWYLYPGNLIVRLSRRYQSLAWLAISPRENKWVTKLYGILNDVRVDIPISDTNYNDVDLPRDTTLPDGMVLPDSNDFVPSPDNPIRPQGTVKVWMFHIRARFYSCLLRQLIVLLIVAVVCIVVIGLILPVGGAVDMGSAAIICFAFASWQVVYVCLHFLDKAQPVPIRALLLVWIIVCGLINNDHAVRTLPDDPKKSLGLQEHFKQWLTKAEKDQNRPYWYRVGPGGENDSIPVIFVSAEGGALRTGAFTGLVLARLERRFPLFKNYLYGYSSVSGGTLGASFFNAQILRNRDSSQIRQEWYKPARKFFASDFLSPVVAKLVFGEVLNACLPVRLECADRAVALEKSFEYGWKEAYPGKDNLLAASFNRTLERDMPALFINTTEAETGLQSVWSNVQLNELPLTQYRDLRKIQHVDLPYSAAINLSDRFPLVSPGGAFYRNAKDADGKTYTYSRHFVDGGYYENKGSETLLQVLQALHLEGKKIKPYILQFNFSGDTTIQSITKGNEITEITGAVYNTRAGRGRVAQDALTNYVKSLNGVFIPLNLTIDEKNLPMNWVLSESVVGKLDALVKSLVFFHQTSTGLDPADSRQLVRLFLYDSVKNTRHAEKK